ncbi:MAG: hypothetical protein CMJ18_04385 [Phycisphaeraceae bacterium]|nr:hypothetical protein [Phycisphaeraceae bacterium]
MLKDTTGHSEVDRQERRPGWRPRAVPRERPEDLSCSLGRVLDISEHGLRAAGTGKCVMLAGQTLDVTVEMPEGPEVFRGMIRWVKKTAYLQYEVGVRFIDDASSSAR